MGILQHKKQIEDAAAVCEAGHKELRDKWASAKDPEKYQIERMSYHLQQSHWALRDLLRVIDQVVK